MRSGREKKQQQADKVVNKWGVGVRAKSPILSPPAAKMQFFIMMCRSSTFNLLLIFGRWGHPELPVALSGMCLRDCWIVYVCWIITVNFPGRRNERFPEDAELLMCEMKARMQSGRKMTVLDLHSPCFQLERRMFEPVNSVPETCSNSDPDTGRL